MLIRVIEYTEKVFYKTFRWCPAIFLLCTNFLNTCNYKRILSVYVCKWLARCPISWTVNKNCSYFYSVNRFYKVFIRFFCLQKYNNDILWKFRFVCGLLTKLIRKGNDDKIFYPFGLFRFHLTCCAFFVSRSGAF